MSQAPNEERRRRLIGDRIREARRAAGLTQSELARHVGVEAMTVSKYERGVFSPGADAALLIAEACSVDARWIRAIDDDVKGDAA